MKTLKLLLVFLTGNILTSSDIIAQKTINEATINYKISIESANGTSLATSLEGAALSIFIRGTQSRTDMVSALGTESNLYDSKSGKGSILKQYSGQKLMITLTRENWAQNNSFYQNMTFNVEDAETIIAGQKCKKATGQSPDGKTFVIYFTPDIILSNNQYDNAFAHLPGLPVQYELQSGKLKFKYLLSSIYYDPVPASKFEVPKSGYRIMTYEENQQLRKQDK